MPTCEIARRTGLSRNTAKKYLRATDEIVDSHLTPYCRPLRINDLDRLWSQSLELLFQLTLNSSLSASFNSEFFGTWAATKTMTNVATTRSTLLGRMVIPPFHERDQFFLDIAAQFLRLDQNL